MKHCFRITPKNMTRYVHSRLAYRTPLGAGTLRGRSILVSKRRETKEGKYVTTAFPPKEGLPHEKITLREYSDMYEVPVASSIYRFHAPRRNYHRIYFTSSTLIMALISLEPSTDFRWAVLCASSTRRSVRFGHFVWKTRSTNTRFNYGIPC